MTCPTKVDGTWSLMVPEKRMTHIFGQGTACCEVKSSTQESDSLKINKVLPLQSEDTEYICIIVAGSDMMSSLGLEMIVVSTRRNECNATLNGLTR